MFNCLPTNEIPTVIQYIINYKINKTHDYTYLHYIITEVEQFIGRWGVDLNIIYVVINDYNILYIKYVLYCSYYTRQYNRNDESQ